ncbi:MAG: ABC transporter ATP-binding protein [Holosporales bacterium]
MKRKGGFFIILLGSLAWSLNEALFPYFIKELIDTVNGLTPGQGDLWQFLGPPALGLGLFWLMMDGASRVQSYFVRRTQPKFKTDVRDAMFAYVQRHSHEYFTKHFGGSVAARIEDMTRATESIIEHVIHNVFAITAAFTLSTFVIAHISPLFSALMWVWFAAHIGLTLVFQDRVANAHARYSSYRAHLSGHIVDVLANNMAMRLFARSRHERERMHKEQKTSRKLEREALWQLEIVNILRALVTTAFMFAIIGLLIKGWNEGWVSVGDFTQITMSCFSLLGLVWHLSFAITDLVKDAGTAKAALELVVQPHDVPDAADAKNLQVTSGEIIFDHVTFTYRRNGNLFRDQSLRIAPGQKVGLVGFSGSGKTTFANLILRLYDVTGGRILIDGQDISEVSQESLRAQIAMIPQEPLLFHRSVADNIRYGRIDAGQEEIIQAAQKAHAHDFIMQLEEGYDTIVGERGGRLSGGQRQRIAIARAILKNAPILILDEATAALDSITEKLIQESMKDLMRGRTTLVIAHRLSTLHDMDRILVFDKGSIVEDGTIEALLKSGGHFASLWQQQSGGMLADRPVV